MLNRQLNMVLVNHNNVIDLRILIHERVVYFDIYSTPLKLIKRSFIIVLTVLQYLK